MHCALCIVNCAFCIVHCALCIVHCALSERCLRAQVVVDGLQLVELVEASRLGFEAKNLLTRLHALAVLHAHQHRSAFNLN